MNIKKTNALVALVLALKVGFSSTTTPERNYNVESLKRRKEEENIRNLASQYGQPISDALINLYRLNNNVADGNRLSIPGLRYDTIGSIVMNQQTGQVFDYTGDKAWRDVDESRSIFADKIAEVMLKIPREMVAGFPLYLKTLYTKSEQIVKKNNERKATKPNYMSGTDSGPKYG
jgi:hypothetical protein